MALDKSSEQTPRALTEEQSAFYHENGWLLADNAISDSWLERLRDARAEIVDGTRSSW